MFGLGIGLLSFVIFFMLEDILTYVKDDKTMIRPLTLLSLAGASIVIGFICEFGLRKAIVDVVLKSVVQ
ncbi:MAG TPA: hypothetical protein VJH71_02790 [Candidatus Paceibacterota bacterium]